MNQDPDRVVPVAPWGPETALIARPFLRVETRQVPAGAACFIQKLAGGATLGEAFVAGAAASAEFDALIDRAVDRDRYRGRIWRQRSTIASEPKAVVTRSPCRRAARTFEWCQKN